jgi:hypothetical protein
MYFGSVFGAFLSVIIISGLMGYIIHSFLNMFDTGKDRYDSQGAMNPMNDETSELEIKDFNILPSLEIGFQHKD